MAVPPLFKASGGTTTLIPTTSWAAPVGMFPTTDRNDDTTYTWVSATSTLTLPLSGLADGYLLIAAFEFEDTSNGRHTPQGQIVQDSGTGNFVGGPTGGYNRDNSEDRAYVRTWAFVDSPSASATFQFQWKRDTDTPTGGTVRSEFQVIPLYYSNHGIYSSTSASLYGGTTANQVTGFTAVDESDTAAIELSSNVVTVKTDNKRYLVLGSQFFEGRGGRTQRWHGLEIDGSVEHAAKAYSYYRNTSNDETGDMFTWLINRVTTDITIEQFCYRGDGVGASQGGADVDGSTPSVGDHALVVLELNDSAEVFWSSSNANSSNLATTGPVDLTPFPSANFNSDSASFSRVSDSAVNVESATDVLFGANVSAAQNTVSTTTRWTAFAEVTVDGAEVSDSFAGDYMRNNQGSQDTFGWSANLLGFQAFAADENIGFSVTELSGSEGGGGSIDANSGWVGAWGINLATLQEAQTLDASAGSLALSGAAADFLRGYRLDASAAALSLTGAAADFVLPSDGVGFIASTLILSDGTDRTDSYTSNSHTLDAETTCIVISVSIMGNGTSPGADMSAATCTFGGVTVPLRGHNPPSAAVSASNAAVFVLESDSLPTGSQTATVTVGGSPGSDQRSCQIVLAEYKDVDTANPVGQVVTAYDTGGTTAAINPDNEGSALCVLGHARDGDTAPWTPNSDTTELHDDSTGSTNYSSSALFYGHHLNADGTSITLGATPSQTPNERGIIIVELNPSAGPILQASGASLSLSGQSADLLRSKILPANDGSLAITGQNADLLKSSLLDAETGSLSLAGQAADLLRALMLEADTGSLSLSGQSADLLEAFLLDAESGSFALSGQDMSVTLSIMFNAETGPFTLSGQPADLNSSAILEAETGSISLTGQPADLIGSAILNAEAGALTFSGQAADLLEQMIFAAAAGSFTLSGQDADLSADSILNAESGAFAFGGSPADLIRSLLVETETGSFDLTGQAADITSELLFELDAGAFTMTGTASNLQRQLIFDAETGDLTFAGQPATFASELILGAESASFMLAGQAADLKRELLLLAASGSLSLAGQAAAFDVAEILGAESGSFALGGTAADLVRSLVLEAGTGAISLTGQDAAFAADAIFELEAGSFDLTGSDADLLRMLRFAAEAGSITLDGQPASLLVSAILEAESGTFTLSGLSAAVGVLVSRRRAVEACDSPNASAGARASNTTSGSEGGNAAAGSTGSTTTIGEDGRNSAA